MEHLEVQTLDETLRGHHWMKGLHTERSVVKKLGSCLVLDVTLVKHSTLPYTICSPLLGKQTHDV